MDGMARFHITYIDAPLGSSVKTLQRGLTEEEKSMTAGSTVQCPGGSDCISVREGEAFTLIGLLLCFLAHYMVLSHHILLALMD